jgi:hypothetical protein
MAESIMQMLARRRPELVRAEAAVIEGVVIPPSRPPAEHDPATAVPPDLGGKQPVQAMLAKLKLPRLRKQEDPEYGGHLTPADGKLAPPCGGCRNEPRHKAVWTRSAWQVELVPAAVAAGFPGVLELCGSHVRLVPVDLIEVRRRWGRGGWVLVREAENEPRQAEVATVVQPNQTLEVSGHYG